MASITIDITPEAIAQMKISYDFYGKVIAAYESVTAGNGKATTKKTTTKAKADPVEEEPEDDDTADRRAELNEMTLKDLKQEALDLDAAEKSELVGAKKADLIELILAAELEDGDEDDDDDDDDDDEGEDTDDDDSEDEDDADDDDDSDEDEGPTEDELNEMSIKELRALVRADYADDAKAEGLNVAKATKDELVEFILGGPDDDDDEDDTDEDEDDDTDDDSDDDADADEDEDDDEDENVITEEQLHEMSVGELRKLMKTEFKVNASPRDKKETLIKKIIDLSEVPY